MAMSPTIVEGEPNGEEMAAASPADPPAVRDSPSAPSGKISKEERRLDVDVSASPAPSPEPGPSTPTADSPSVAPASPSDFLSSPTLRDDHEEIDTSNASETGPSTPMDPKKSNTALVGNPLASDPPVRPTKKSRKERDAPAAPTRGPSKSPADPPSSPEKKDRKGDSAAATPEETGPPPLLPAKPPSFFVDGRGKRRKKVIWKCDVCKVAAFENFDDCAAHEVACAAARKGASGIRKGKPPARAGGGGPKGSPAADSAGTRRRRTDANLGRHPAAPSHRGLGGFTLLQVAVDATVDPRIARFHHPPPPPPPHPPAHPPRYGIVRLDPIYPPGAMAPAAVRPTLLYECQPPVIPLPPAQAAGATAGGVYVDGEVSRRSEKSSGRGQLRQCATWTASEDARLTRLVRLNGTKKWTATSKSFPGKTKKQLRDRWIYQLDPRIKRGAWTDDENRIILEQHQKLGNKWSKMAKLLPGRTDNAIKNHWNHSLLVKIKLFCEAKYDDSTIFLKDGRSSFGDDLEEVLSVLKSVSEDDETKGRSQKPKTSASSEDDETKDRPRKPKVSASIEGCGSSEEDVSYASEDEEEHIACLQSGKRTSPERHHDTEESAAISSYTVYGNGYHSAQSRMWHSEPQGHQPNHYILPWDGSLPYAQVMMPPPPMPPPPPMQQIPTNATHSTITKSDTNGNAKRKAGARTKGGGCKKQLNKNRGDWTEMEDSMLKDLFALHGEGKWKQISSLIRGKTEVDCRKRWRDHLSPKNFAKNVVKEKTGEWTQTEDTILMDLIRVHGEKRKWRLIASHMPGKSTGDCVLRWREHLSPSAINRSPWSATEYKAILDYHTRFGNSWQAMSLLLPGRTKTAIMKHWKEVIKKKIEQYMSLNPGKVTILEDGRFSFGLDFEGVLGTLCSDCTPHRENESEQKGASGVSVCSHEGCFNNEWKDGVCRGHHTMLLKSRILDGKEVRSGASIENSTSNTGEKDTLSDTLDENSETDPGLDVLPASQDAGENDVLSASSNEIPDVDAMDPQYEAEEPTEKSMVNKAPSANAEDEVEKVPGASAVASKKSQEIAARIMGTARIMGIDPVTGPIDAEVTQTLCRLKQRRRWPVKQKRAIIFNREDLTQVRLHKSKHFKHVPILIEGGNGKTQVRQTCALCGKYGERRKSSFMCSLCEVPLCRVPLPGEERSHFDIWHSEHDLKAAQVSCSIVLRNHRDLSLIRRTGKSKREKEVGSDQE